MMLREREREVVDLFKLRSFCRVSYLCSLSLLRGALGWSVPVIVSFPGHTHVVSARSTKVSRGRCTSIWILSHKE